MERPNPEIKTPADEEAAGAFQGGTSDQIPNTDDIGKPPKSQEKSALTGNTEAAISFLQRWHGKGPYQLHAMDPERKGKPVTVFAADEEACRKFVDHWNGKRNIYFTVNRVKPGEKRTKADITAMVGLHIDLDPPKTPGRDLEADRSEIFGLLTENLPEGVPAPSFIIDSGGGYWGLWPFKSPKETNAEVTGIPPEEIEKTITELERWNIGIEEAFGKPYADNCFNIDRICRLPGTVNIPDKKKREAGRTEALAVLVHADDRKHSANDFPKGEPRSVAKPKSGQSSDNRQAKVDPSSAKRLESIDKLPREVAEWCGPLIETGIHPEDSNRYDGGKDRSGALYAVVCELVRAGVDDDLIYGIITDPRWKIAASVLDKSNVQRYATRQIDKAHANVATPWLKGWNDRYCIISASGAGTKVLEEIWDPATRGYELVFHSFEDIKKANLHRLTEVPKFDKDGNPDGVTFKKTADLWLEHPRAHRRQKVIFVPGKDLDDDPYLEGIYYNLWRGFNINPEAGDKHESFLTHLRDNVCNGNQEHFDYLMNWMAYAVQHPDRPGYAAIVLRGGKGVGKSIVPEHFGVLFGPRHYKSIANSKHLTGNFNAHLQATIVLFADEAFFAGDGSHEQVLKHLVTSDTLPIERKGHDVQSQRNYLHIMMASNNEWVVPASKDERRYFVLDVGDRQKQNTAYFAAIVTDLKSGGYENLLHHLLHRDISEFDVRNVPNTEALKSQKKESAGPIERALHDCFSMGEIPAQESSSGATIKLETARFTTFVNRRLKRNEHKVTWNAVAKVFERLGMDKDRSARPSGYMLKTIPEMRSKFEEKFDYGDWQNLTEKSGDKTPDWFSFQWVDGDTPF